MFCPKNFDVFGDIAVGVSVILQNNCLVMLNILSDYLLLAFSLQSLLKGKRLSGILTQMTQMPEMGTLGACVEGTQWECVGAQRDNQGGGAHRDNQGGGACHG